MVFKYKAYNNLLAELGRLDYIFETTHLAILEFKSLMDISGNKENFLKEKSMVHGIVVNYDPKNDLDNLTVLAQIANVYHYVETYFYELKDEYNQYEEDDNKQLVLGRNPNKDETKLQKILNLLKILNRTNKIDFIPEYLLDIFHYYYLLRVYFSHKSRIKYGDIKAGYNKALNHFNDKDKLPAKFQKFDAPKEINNLTFNDYFLFTNISKELSLFLSSFLYPNPIGFSKIESLALKIGVRNKPKRKERFINNHLITNFGYICKDDSDKRDFSDIIANCL